MLTQNRNASLPYYTAWLTTNLGSSSQQAMIKTKDINENYCAELNGFISLTWECSPFSKILEFLDLTATILPGGNLNFWTYQKTRNIYLYLPSYSNRTPKALRGIILVTLRHDWEHTTNMSEYDKIKVKSFLRLTTRGYSTKMLRPLSKATDNKIDSKATWDKNICDNGLQQHQAKDSSYTDSITPYISRGAKYERLTRQTATTTTQQQTIRKSPSQPRNPPSVSPTPW